MGFWEKQVLVEKRLKEWDQLVLPRLEQFSLKGEFTMADVSLDEITLKFKNGQMKQPDARKARAYLRKNGLSVKEAVKSTAPKTGKISWAIDADKPVEVVKPAPEKKAVKAKAKAKPASKKPAPVEETASEEEFDDDFFDDDDD